MCGAVLSTVLCYVFIQAGYDSDVEEAMQKGNQPKQPKQQKQAALKLSTGTARCLQHISNSSRAPQST
jgi:hypothetical protein